MVRGTKPAPTRLKILKGVEKARINRNEPVAAPGIPDCPEHLDELARKEWERITPFLLQMGVLSKIDGTSLALYCEAHSLRVQAFEKIGDEGMVTETQRGGDRVTSWVKVHEQARRDCMRFLVEFGVTPSSRSRIKVTPEKPKDELAEFLGKQA